MKLHYESLNISANKMPVEAKWKDPELAEGRANISILRGAVKVCLPKQINLEYAT